MFIINGFVLPLLLSFSRPTGSPTKSPTPQPTAIRSTRLTQVITFSGISNAAAYNADAHTRSMYEKSYGAALGMVQCQNGACAYKTGASVSSTATRRGAAVTFTAEQVSCGGGPSA